MSINPFYDPYRVLMKVYSEGARLKIALSEVDFEPSGRARSIKTCYGVLEHENYFSYLIKAFAPKNPKTSSRVVLKIALYWILYLKKPRYTATYFAVDLIKRLGKGGSAGFLNAFLRNFDETALTLPEGDEGLSIKFNFPLFAIKKLKEEYGERAERIMAAKSAGVCVRFVKNEEKYLSLPHQKTPFPHLFLFPNFTREEGFFLGDYTFQSIGSVAVAELIEPCEKLLDACAAPGGKSVYLSERCKEVLACELHPHRGELIKAYIKRMKRENVEVRVLDSTIYREEFSERFDGVLCDVPCSGFGTVAENPDLLLQKKEQDSSLFSLQRAILFNCSRYVKRGGALYYATCTLFKEENDCAVEAFLKEHLNFAFEETSSPLPFERTKFGIQFLPDVSFGAGFYLAKLRRRE